MSEEYLKQFNKYVEIRKLLFQAFGVVCEGTRNPTHCVKSLESITNNMCQALVLLAIEKVKCEKEV